MDQRAVGPGKGEPRGWCDRTTPKGFLSAINKEVSERRQTLTYGEERDWKYRLFKFQWQVLIFCEDVVEKEEVS